MTKKLIVALAILAFGSILGARSMSVSYEKEIASLRADLDSAKTDMERFKTSPPVGTAGERLEREQLIDTIKRELQEEMGLLPLRLMRQRRDSFVEMYSYDDRGASSYGTAGYLGNGYFLTVKHGVIALGQEGNPDPRRITSVKLAYRGKMLNARVVDAGNANVEVDPGDWAILKVRGPVDLPPLNIDLGYRFDFAEPIFRLGNDYSKGIVVATGYIGQQTPNDLVTSLTDGHPGVSGGGVLNIHGDLVGIPVGRMQGDYRFSFILPLRQQMFRKVPHLAGP